MKPNLDEYHPDTWPLVTHLVVRLAVAEQEVAWMEWEFDNLVEEHGRPTAINWPAVSRGRRTLYRNKLANYRGKLHTVTVSARDHEPRNNRLWYVGDLDAWCEANLGGSKTGERWGRRVFSWDAT